MEIHWLNLLVYMLGAYTLGCLTAIVIILLTDAKEGQY